MLDLKKKNICIISYIHECGLYYLAKYFYKDLIKNNNITWISKNHYKKDKFGMYNPDVILPKKERLNKNIKPLDINSFDSFLTKNGFDVILSFETMMKEPWIFNHKDKIIDVPMIEWVDRKEYMNYGLLNKILCLNECTYNYFKNLPNAKLLDFKIQDKNITNDKNIDFYHQASLNENYSSKNTKDVISAFSKTDKILVITGILSEKEKVSLTKNIKYLGVLSRSEINSLYEKSKWLIAPSSSEGLGLQIIEAKSYNCKVLTSSYETIAEYGDYVVDLDKDIKSQIFDFLKNF